MRKLIAACALACALAFASLPARAGGSEQSGGAAPTPTPSDNRGGSEQSGGVAPPDSDSFLAWVESILASIF